MSLSSPGEITLLLSRANDPKALAELIPLVYEELHKMAVHQFRRERSDHTLQPTAVLHEACLRLLTPGTRGVSSRLGYRNRAYFFAAASRAMRQVLVDHARRKRAQRRGGNWQRVGLDSLQLASGERLTDVLTLDDALNRLGALDRRLLSIVELRFFGRMTEKETAVILRMGQSTVRRQWAIAKAWLERELHHTRR
jgi:RNA polymerase sigma-70 factor, ECF subfamily